MIDYIIIYCCIVIPFSLVYVVWYDLSHKLEKKKRWQDIVVVPIISPIVFPFILYSVYEDYEEWKKKRRERAEEIAHKASIGLKPEEGYLTFSSIAGAGMIVCNDCGYRKNIIGFTHGADSCRIGRQCPSCHALVVEYNCSEEFHTFGKAEEDFSCPECGALIRKKDEDILKGNLDPVFCPKCHSARLHYQPKYLT